MKNLWIAIVLVACFGVYAKAQADNSYDDYFNYDDLDDLDKFLEDFNEKPVNEKTDIENDLKVEEEIKQFRETDGDEHEAEADEPEADEPKNYLYDGLQLEDNRFKSNEKQSDDKNDESDKDNDFEAVDDSSVDENEAKSEENIENRPEPDDPNAPSRDNDYALLWGDDSIAPLPVPESAEKDENEAIFEDTKKFLEEKDADNFEQEINDAIEKKIDVKSKIEQPNMGEILEETKELLAESDDTFDNENLSSNEEPEPDDSENGKKEDNDEEEDTVDKVYADLNADLDKLFKTLDKLKDDVSENSNEDAGNVEDADNHDIDINKKASSENDVEDINKALNGIDNLFEENNFDNLNMEGSEEVVEDTKDDDPVDLDKLLENILEEDDMKSEDSAAEVFEPFMNDAIDEPNPGDIVDKDAISYLNDALVDEPKENAESQENFDDDNAEDTYARENVSVEKGVLTAQVDSLTSSELDDLVSQFSILHSEDLDVNSDNFEKNVAPVHITLNLDEPTIITSPNYPEAYPTNNIVDWILEGPGVGIEFNITNFAVNGALGDYLLVKPGGIDDSGHDGLIFTYRLTSERRYRFTDVDRLFMRFESKIGMMAFNGFSISAKMIAPLPSISEPIPEPEPVVTPPHSTATVTLAIRVPDFEAVKEKFHQLIADMAELYIRENDLDRGLNTTYESTHITHVGLCPMTWPEFESCTAVTFGVTLIYEDEDHEPRLTEGDLKDMWTTYSKQDPFALRLRSMGLSEFHGPDSGTLAAWLLVGGAVVISMVVLAFVLWRYSCFEDYTRMKAYSDTDSIQNEKRKLDLYPTPHQTLPPLYAEHEYKWPEDDSARVDMGGFANRSYNRDNMYDFDSDEDVITPRDRKGVLTAKNFSSNV